MAKEFYWQSLANELDTSIRPEQYPYCPRDWSSSLALPWIQGLPMRCYFHLVNGHETIPDDTGVEVSDVDDAKAQALVAIHEIREETIQVGASWQGWLS